MASGDRGTEAVIPVVALPLKTPGAAIAKEFKLFLALASFETG
jgi:hypothetical protein